MNSTVQEQREHRTSLYLVLRAEALTGALKFFLAPTSDKRRRLQFLAQSDYWEWEIDNLIFSFTNLAERQKTWTDSRTQLDKLYKLGVPVDVKMLKEVRWRRGGWALRAQQQRVAPVPLLEECIDTWNTLIDQVEREFITPMKDKVKKWNIQGHTNLKHLRKKMPVLKIMD